MGAIASQITSPTIVYSTVYSGADQRSTTLTQLGAHDDVIKWKHFPRYWPFVRGIHRSPSQKPVTLNFDVFFYLRLNKRLSKQSWGWWFETPSRSLWRKCFTASLTNNLKLEHGYLMVFLFFFVRCNHLSSFSLTAMAVGGAWVRWIITAFW